MLRILAAIAGVALSGCAAVRVDYRPARESQGEIVFQAMRNHSSEILRAGYVFKLIRDGVEVGRYPSIAAPVRVRNLAPGSYEVHVKGRGIRRQRELIHLRPGQSVTVTLYTEYARHWSYFIGKGVGRGLWYTAVGTAYVFGAAVLMSDLFDDLCDDCHRDPCRCGQ